MSSSSAGITAAVGIVKALVMFDFAGTGPNEMALRAGEVIDVVKRGAPGGWCKGKLGAFPTDYVEFKVPTPPLTSGSQVPVNSTLINETKAAAAAGLFAGIPTNNAIVPQVNDLLTGETSRNLNPTVNRGSLIDDAFIGLDAQPIKISKTASTAATVDTLLPLDTLEPTTAPRSSFILSGMKPLPPLQSEKPAAQVQSVISPTTQALASIFSADAATPRTTSSSNQLDFMNSSNPEPSKFDAFSSISTSNSSIGFVSVGNSLAVTQTSAVEIPKPPQRRPSKLQKLARVKFAHVGKGQNELSIEVGQILVVHKQESEWWYGCTQSDPSKLGFFPGSYVEAYDLPASVTASEPPCGGASSASNGYSGASMGLGESTVEPSRPQVMRRPSDHQQRMANKPLQIGGGAVSVFGGSRFVGSSFGIDAPANLSPCPLWQQYVFWDLFADAQEEIKVNRDYGSTVSAYNRIRHALHVVRSTLRLVNKEEQANQDLKSILNFAVGVFNEACDFCDQIPNMLVDYNATFSFLQSTMMRIKSMRSGDILLLPVAWKVEDGADHVVILMLRRYHEDSDKDFSITIVNTKEGPGGLDYHPFDLDPVDGSMLRNLSFELKNIPNQKIYNSTFWYPPSSHSHFLPCIL